MLNVFVKAVRNSISPSPPDERESFDRSSIKASSILGIKSNIIKFTKFGEDEIDIIFNVISKGQPIVRADDLLEAMVKSGVQKNRFLAMWHEEMKREFDIDSLITKRDFGRFFHALEVGSESLYFHWWDSGFIGSSLMLLALCIRNVFGMLQFFFPETIQSNGLLFLLDAFEFLAIGLILVSGLRYIRYRNQLHHALTKFRKDVREAKDFVDTHNSIRKSMSTRRRRKFFSEQIVPDKDGI